MNEISPVTQKATAIKRKLLLGIGGMSVVGSSAILIGLELNNLVSNIETGSSTGPLLRNIIFMGGTLAVYGSAGVTTANTLIDAGAMIRAQSEELTTGSSHSPVE